MGAYYIPGTVLGTGGKTVEVLASWNYILVRRNRNFFKKKSYDTSGADKFYEE